MIGSLSKSSVVELKLCSRCKQEKPFADFSKDKSRKDGHCPWCKECTRESRQAHACNICQRVPDRLKRGLRNTCYERLRKNGLLDGIADDPIPNGAWLIGRGHRSEVLDSTPPPPVTPARGMASRGEELPDFVPVIRRTHPLGTRTIWACGYVGLKTADGVRPEHKVVMEGELGRPLARGENVHHKNGDRSDNRPENLELWYRGQPAGQRVYDLIEYVAQYHADEVIAALGKSQRRWPE